MLSFLYGRQFQIITWSLQQESLRILVLGCACGVLVEREIDASLAGLIVHQQGSLIVIYKCSRG